MANRIACSLIFLICPLFVPAVNAVQDADLATGTEVSPGFNDSYVAEIGLINGDQLQDILIRSLIPGVESVIPDFVLIQQPQGGFSLQDAADFRIPRRLVRFNSIVNFVDLNIDGAVDMGLFGIDNYIEGASDRVIFANPESNAIPRDHVGLPADVQKFFSEVSAWIDDENYFDDNARVANVPEVSGHSFLRDSNGDVIAFGDSDFSRQLGDRGCNDLEECFPQDANCDGEFVTCILFYGDGNEIFGGNTSSPCIREEFQCTYSAEEFEVHIVDGLDDPDDANYWAWMRLEFSPESRIEVLDYSDFNQDAYLLVMGYMAPIRGLGPGSLVPGSHEANVIADTLESYLNTIIFGNRLRQGSTEANSRN